MNMTYLKSIIILFSIVFSTNSYAADTFWDRATNQEHVASGYAFSLSSYLIYKNTLELSKEKSLLLSAGTAFLLSALRDRYIFRSDPSLASDHLKATALGVSAATVFSITIDF